MLERFTLPKVYLVGYTQVDLAGLSAYLRETDQAEFLNDYYAALDAGISSGEALCSMYAKLCYRSLSVGNNSNITRVRSIHDNIIGTLESGHGSVFEHLAINFVVSDCSRIFTHELVRHRVGTAYSQESGRYCRIDYLRLVKRKCLEPYQDLIVRHLESTEKLIYTLECLTGLREPPPNAEAATESDWVPSNALPFAVKKELTSAIRSVAPEGRVNEIGMTINMRALRHIVQLRTHPSADEEIRQVFSQVYDLVNAKFPLLFHGCRATEVNGCWHVSNMPSNPYDVKAGDVATLSAFSDQDLRNELEKRNGNQSNAG